MKNILYLLVLVLSLSGSSSCCIFKEVKKRPQREKESLPQEQNAVAKLTVNEEEQKLILKIDSLSLQIQKLVANTPQILGKQVDSLQQQVQYLQLKLTASEQHHKMTSDSLGILKAKIRSLFSITNNTAKRITHQKKSYDCYIVDLAESDVKLYWKNKEGRPLLNLQNLSKMIEAEQDQLVFATNAGMYTPQHKPQGLFVKDGKVLRPIDRQKNKFGNFYMEPNGVFMIDTSNHARIVKTTAYNGALAKRTNYATQSGPMVVVAGKINPIFKKDSRHFNIRSGVGIINSTKIVFIISNQKVTFHEFASVFKDIFKCPNALYLDGAISEMYLPELGRFQDGGNFGPIIGIKKR